MNFGICPHNGLKAIEVENIQLFTPVGVSPKNTTGILLLVLAFRVFITPSLLRLNNFIQRYSAGRSNNSLVKAVFNENLATFAGHNIFVR